MNNHKRSIRNIFVQPKFLLRLSLYYVGTGGIIFATVGTMVFYKLGIVRELIASNLRMDLQTQTRINDLTVECVEVSMIGFGVFIFFSFLFAMLVSHRIAGPQIAIRAYIEELKQGNYNYNRNLRERDELTDMMSALQELTSILKERDKNIQA